MDAAIHRCCFLGLHMVDAMTGMLSGHWEKILHSLGRMGVIHCTWGVLGAYARRRGILVNSLVKWILTKSLFTPLHSLI
jgi:hypothetical protein